MDLAIVAVLLLVTIMVVLAAERSMYKKKYDQIFKSVTNARNAMIGVARENNNLTNRTILEWLEEILDRNQP